MRGSRPISRAGGVTVKSTRFAVKLVGLVFALTVLLGVALAPRAGAVGVEVFRTDQYGRKTSTVTKVGNTGSTAFCVGTGVGAIRLGVAVCYL